MPEEQVLGMARPWLLPDGWESISGACAAEDWVLCWSGAHTCAWHVEKGWLPLPDLPDVEELGGASGLNVSAAALADGVLLAFGSSSWQLAFWPWGAPSFRSSGQAPRPAHGLFHSELRLFPAGPDHAVLHEGGHLVLVRCASAGIAAVMPITGFKQPMQFSGVWHDAVHGKLLLLGLSGISEVDLESLEVMPVSSVWFSTSTVFPGGYDADGYLERVVEADYMEGVSERELTTNESRPLGLANIEGCEILWHARAAGDVELMTAVVRALASLPAVTWDDPSSIHGILLHGSRPVAIAAGAGLYIVPGAPLPVEAPHGEVSFVERFTPAREALVTWELLLAPTAALPRAFDLLCGAPISSFAVSTLIRAIANAGGPVVGTLLLDHVRSCAPGCLDTEGIERVRALFAAGGSGAAGRVEQALAEASGQEYAAACAAVGALEPAPGGTVARERASALWPRRRQIPMSACIEAARGRNLLATYAAAGSLGELGRLGRSMAQRAAKPLLGLLRYPDEQVRQRAMESLAVLSVLSDAHAEDLAEALRHEPSGQVRAAGVSAAVAHIREGVTCDVLIEGLTDCHWSARFEAWRAAKVLGEQPHLLEHALRVFDAWSILTLAGRHASSSSDLAVGIVTVAGVFERAGQQAAKLFADPLLFARSDPATAGMLARIAAIELVGSLLAANRRDQSDDDGLVRQLLQVIGIPEVQPDDVDAALRPKPVLMQLLPWANRLRENWPELWRRLGAVAVARFGLPRDRSGTSATTHGPLHERLRSLGSRSDPLGLFESAARELAGERGAPGFLALFCLANAGDRGAFDEAWRRTVAGELNGFPLAHTILLDTSIGERFGLAGEAALTRYLDAVAVPATMRFAVDVERTSRIEWCGRLDFHRKLAADALVPLRTRLAIGERVRAQLGDPSVLLGAWDSYTARVDLQPEQRRSWLRDTLLCGRSEHMEEFRRLFRDSPWTPDLDVFAALGEASDIPLLMSAEGLNTLRREEAVAAIEARMDPWTSPMTLALGFEQTLIRSKDEPVARSGLCRFLARCRLAFPRIVIFTEISEAGFAPIAGGLNDCEVVPDWFIWLERIEWASHGRLDLVPGADGDVLLVEAVEARVHPDDRDYWIRVAPFAPDDEPDDELERVFRILREKASAMLPARGQRQPLDVESV